MIIEKLRSVLEKLKSQNKIIVAALSNRNKYTYPASMDNVIGVKHVFYGKYEILQRIVPRQLLTLDKHDYEFVENSDDGTNIFLTGCFESRDGNILDSCNSFATAYVTALVSNIKLRGIHTYEEVRKNLAENAIHLSRQFCNQTYTDSPCIGMVGKKNQILELILLLLREKFKDNGYNCLSGIAFAYSELSNELFDFQMGTKDISRIFEYDICLYGINIARIRDEKLQNNEFDIVICILESDWDSTLDDLTLRCEYTIAMCNNHDVLEICRKRKNIDFCFDYKEINQLYETILSLYEKEEN